jgi:hypothetical protein
VHKLLLEVCWKTVLSALIGPPQEPYMTPLFEVKTDLLLRQTRLRLPEFSEGEIEIDPIEKGGSDRRFYRVRCVPEQSLILVKYNLEGAENRHYVRIAEFLAEHEIAAPKIYFHDAEEGLIWIEDLGESDLFSFRDDTWLVRGALYRSALDEIAKLHDLPESDWVELHGEMPPEFNARMAPDGDDIGRAAGDRAEVAVDRLVLGQEPAADPGGGASGLAAGTEQRTRRLGHDRAHHRRPGRRCDSE